MVASGDLQSLHLDHRFSQSCSLVKKSQIRAHTGQSRRHLSSDETWPLNDRGRVWVITIPASLSIWNVSATPNPRGALSPLTLRGFELWGSQLRASTGSNVNRFFFLVYGSFEARCTGGSHIKAQVTSLPDPHWASQKTVLIIFPFDTLLCIQHRNGCS